MAEDQPAGAIVDAHEFCPLCGSEVFDLLLSGGGLQDAEVTGAVQHREQEQPAGRCGQIRGPGGEQRLQAPAERQDHGQRLGRGALRAAERRRELQQGEWVPPGLGYNPLANPRRQLREAGTEQAARRLLIQRPKLVLRQPGTLEEALLSRPARSQEADAAAGQPACDEPEHPRAGPV